jgi:hypothetical protein
MRELSVCREKIFALAEEKTVKQKKKRKRIFVATGAFCLCAIIATVGFFHLNAEPMVITAADLENKSGNVEETLKTDLQRALEQYEGENVLFRVTVSVSKGGFGGDSSISSGFTFNETVEYFNELASESAEILNDFENRQVFVAELTAEEIEVLQKKGYYELRLVEK